jgi:hypothetical protein
VVEGTGSVGALRFSVGSFLSAGPFPIGPGFPHPSKAPGQMLKIGSTVGSNPERHCCFWMYSHRAWQAIHRIHRSDIEIQAVQAQKLA